jgi:glycosyltransferase involved in cell wall biosynthesis
LARLGVKHIAIGESVQRNERINFGLTTKIIPNWFDSNRFSFTSDVDRTIARQSLNIPYNERVVVSVGNCSPVKNHTAILESLALIKPEKCPLYLHVGMEESGYPERIQATKLGIESRVKFIGSLSDIRPVLRAADVFIMTSNYEGFGIAAIEAMAVGLPVVLSDVPGLSDFKNISPCVTHTANDPKEISFLLCNMLDSAEELRQLHGEELALTIGRRYGLDIGPKAYTNLYSQKV